MREKAKRALSSVNLGARERDPRRQREKAGVASVASRTRRATVAGGPRVRIHLPPAASQVRTRAGVQALILILDNHEFFRQVGVALTTVIPRKRTGLIAAIVGWAVALARDRWTWPVISRTSCLTFFPRYSCLPTSYWKASAYPIPRAIQRAVPRAAATHARLHRCTSS